MSESISTSTSLQPPEIGVGTWAWGDRWVWDYKKSQDHILHDTFTRSVERGVRFFDTAEVYGPWRSERLIGTFAQKSPTPIQIATKFMPLPWRLTKTSLLRALKGSLARLTVPYVDLYQIHFPLPPIKVETWMEAMVEAVETGLTRNVGVSNYDTRTMYRAHTILNKNHVALFSNQVEYSLLQKAPEHSGLLKECRELGTVLLAYSPLAQGVLTGKYSPSNPPAGWRRLFKTPRMLSRIQPLLDLMWHIGSHHNGATPAQVALNWCICKGVIPIPGAKTPRQAIENADAAGWRLTEQEVNDLDEMSNRVREN